MNQYLQHYLIPLQPIFLHRNLNYMSQRMSRTHKSRATFKIDSLLADKLKANRAACSCFGDNMTIMFQGYFDRFQSTITATPNTTAPIINNTAHSITNNSNNINNNNTNNNTAKIRVEVLLLKIAQKKRKDSSSTSIKQIGVVEIAHNPPEQQWDTIDAKFPTISLNTDLLDPADGPCTQIVVFRTQPVGGSVLKEDPQNYTSELMLFDKTGRCLLTDGEYQLSLQEAVATSPLPPVTIDGGGGSAAAVTNGQKNGSSPKKYSSWENLSVFHSDSSGFEDQFEKNPIVKFQLHWTEHPYSGEYERLAEVKREPKEKVSEGAVSEKKPKEADQKDVKIATGRKNVAQSMAAHEIFGVPSSQLRIAFHFVHNNVSHQTTEQTHSMDCPWCSLSCLSLYSLLKHLKLCHARFAFNFVHTGGTSARIEVSINELFDGSYAGAPNNYLTTPSAGYAFSRSGPVRRTTSTHVQVCRPRRLKPSLAEFTETDEALEMNGTAGCGAGGIDRPYLTGHNRLYHHTMTCLPVHARELDADSEEESDPRWLKQKTMMMIDEFTDVNEGEKELMKMWNLHVMRHGFVGDCQTALACEMFVEMKGREVLAKNLYRNFVVHMCSLFDYGLVSSEAFHKAVQKLQRSLNESQEAKGVIYEARKEHREHWTTVGYVKFEQQQQEKEEQEMVQEEEERREREEKGKAEKVKVMVGKVDQLMKKGEKSAGAVAVTSGKKKSSSSSGSGSNSNNSNNNREKGAAGPGAESGGGGATTKTTATTTKTSSITTATTRSRELFQKPKGGQEPLSSSSKKKAVHPGSTKPMQSSTSTAADNPNKRKLERGETIFQFYFF